MTSPTIEYLGEPDCCAVKVSWNTSSGNYDLRYYMVTVHSSLTNEIITSIKVVSDNDTVSVVLHVPKNMKVDAKIVTTSYCLSMSDGAIIMLECSSGKCLVYIHT